MEKQFVECCKFYFIIVIFQNDNLTIFLNLSSNVLKDNVFMVYHATLQRFLQSHIDTRHLHLFRGVSSVITRSAVSIILSTFNLTLSLASLHFFFVFFSIVTSYKFCMKYGLCIKFFSVEPFGYLWSSLS